MKKKAGVGTGSASKKLRAGAAKNMWLLYRLLEDKNFRKLDIVTLQEPEPDKNVRKLDIVTLQEPEPLGKKIRSQSR